MQIQTFTFISSLIPPHPRLHSKQKRGNRKALDGCCGFVCLFDLFGCLNSPPPLPRELSFHFSLQIGGKFHTNTFMPMWKGDAYAVCVWVWVWVWVWVGFYINQSSIIPVLMNE